MCCYDASDEICFAAQSTDYTLYEQNAKTLVTLWGPYDTGLHDYSYRLWADLVSSFYVPRWTQWFQGQRKALVAGLPFHQPAFDHAIQLWEEDWVLAPSNYSTKPTGNAVKISENLLSEFF